MALRALWLGVVVWAASLVPTHAAAEEMRRPMQKVRRAAPPAPARALACTPLSTRNASEVLSPLRSTDDPDLPEQAISIEPGESLCVAGKVGPSQRLEPLQLVAARDETVVLGVSLLSSTDGGTVLTLQNHTPDWLYLRMARPLGASPYVSATELLGISPGEGRRFRWSAAYPRIVLYELRVPRQEPQKAYVHLPGGRQVVEQSGSQAGVGLYGLYGVMPLALPALAAELKQQGYSSMPTALALGGGGFWVSVMRLRLDVAIYAGSNTFRNRATGDEFSFQLFSGGFSLGWEALRYRSLLLSPSVGLAKSNLLSESLPRSPFPLPSLRPRPDPKQGLAIGGALLDLGVGLEQVIFTLAQHGGGYTGVTLGMKAGYNLQLSNGEWSGVDEASDQQYSGGPSIDVSGPYVLFSLGLALRASKI